VDHRFTRLGGGGPGVGWEEPSDKALLQPKNGLEPRLLPPMLPVGSGLPRTNRISDPRPPCPSALKKAGLGRLAPFGRDLRLNSQETDG
jgi:hypothetical protein